MISYKCRNCGGVQSAHQIGLIDAIKNGNYNFLDREGESDPAKRAEIEKKIFSECDYFLSSANGISEDGVIVNVAAPINAQRFGLDTPCANFGKCMDCQHEQCICCEILTTRYSRHRGRMKAIIVNEDLGF